MHRRRVVVHEVDELVVAHELVGRGEGPLEIGDADGQDAALLHVPLELEDLGHEAVVLGIGHVQLPDVLRGLHRVVGGIDGGVLARGEAHATAEGRGGHDGAEPGHEVGHEVVVDAAQMVDVPALLGGGHHRGVGEVGRGDGLGRTTEEEVHRLAHRCHRSLQRLEGEDIGRTSVRARESLIEPALEVRALGCAQRRCGACPIVRTAHVDPLST